MKLSVSRDLHERAWSCAEAIDEKRLTDFIDLAILNDLSGRLDGVAFNKELMTATRDERVVIIFSGDARGWSSDRVKLALVRAVLFAEGAAQAQAPLGDDVIAEIKEMNRLTLQRARRMAELGVG